MSIVLKKIINEFQLIKNAHRILHSAGTNVVTITCGSDVTGFDAVRVVRGAYGVGGRLSGRGKGVAKQAGVATGGPLLTICTKGGVGTCWRRNPSGTVSVTWRSVPGRFRRGARLDTYCLSGRTWTLRALPVRSERARGGRKARWPGFPHSGKERARTEGESGNAGVPSRPYGLSSTHSSCSTPSQTSSGVSLALIWAGAGVWAGAVSSAALRLLAVVPGASRGGFRAGVFPTGAVRSVWSVGGRTAGLPGWGPDSPLRRGRRPSRPPPSTLSPAGGPWCGLCWATEVPADRRV
jgi:hypothetical protein